jgi:hypothetical protein
MLFFGGMMTTTRALRAQQKAMPVLGYLSSGSSGPLHMRPRSARD